MTDRATLVARLFHETYERLAPQFGYQTRKASAVPWDDVPDANKRLMVAVAAEVLAAIAAPPVPDGDALTKRKAVGWRKAALRVGETLAGDGPKGYDSMTPEQWRDWAIPLAGQWRKKWEAAVVIGTARLDEIAALRRAAPAVPASEGGQGVGPTGGYEAALRRAAPAVEEAEDVPLNCEVCQQPIDDEGCCGCTPNAAPAVGEAT